MSRWTVARIVDGRRRASVIELAAIGATVGRDVRLHAYPGGDPIRDAGQQRLLDRFRARLHPSLAMPTEVPLPIEGDLRAWDAMVRGVDWRRPAEAGSERALEPHHVPVAVELPTILPEHADLAKADEKLSSLLGNPKE
jgi:hypothetical protein